MARGPRPPWPVNGKVHACRGARPVVARLQWVDQARWRGAATRPDGTRCSSIKSVPQPDPTGPILNLHVCSIEGRQSWARW